MNASRWIEYFENHRNQPPDGELNWSPPAPDPTRPDISLLAGSLAIFQLGESGGGTRLRAYVEALVRQEPAFAGYGRAVELFIREEQAHAELLRQMVARLGGQCLDRQWSNSIFRGVRSAFGLEFNVQVLLSAELLARAYYGLLARHAPDAVIRAACLRITRDEVGHIAFHVDFFRDRLGALPRWRAALWRAQFRCLYELAGRVVWWDHGKALRACGISQRRFREKAARAAEAFLGGVVTVRRVVPPGVSVPAP